MQIVKIEKAKTIAGLRVRTNNQHEMQADTAKIGTLHADFAEQVAVDYSQGEPLYGVYYQYDSDHQGDFSVLVGSDRSCLTTEARLEDVTVEPGKYLVFSGKGDMPQTVINVWQKIWQYFADPEADYQRRYSTDFECYNGPDSVDVYIAVKC